MNESLGARLRLQRERREISLSTIAADTKIKASLLEALERDDISHWPEGIYRRAFVKSYAQAIGLEPAAVLREFLELHPDPVEVSPFDTETPQNTSPEPTTRFRRLFTSAIAAAPARKQIERREVSTSLTPAVAREYAVADEPAATEPNLPAVTARDLVEPAPASASADAPTAVRLPLDDELDWEAPAASSEAQKPSGEDRPEPDLVAVAQLCTRLGQVLDHREIAPVLEDAAELLDAVGLIVWSWDPRISVLKPSLSHGYSEALLARLPTVASDAENAVATAFRCAETCVVNAGDEATGAAVVPLMAPGGCVGVLAIELRHRGEQRASIRAMATILAAQLVTLIGSAPLAEAANA